MWLGGGSLFHGLPGGHQCGGGSAGDLQGDGVRGGVGGVGAAGGEARDVQRVGVVLWDVVAGARRGGQPEREGEDMQLNRYSLLLEIYLLT